MISPAGEDGIVETALFLINQASFITGQIIRVDGGRCVIAVRNMASIIQRPVVLS